MAQLERKHMARVVTTYDAFVGAVASEAGITRDDAERFTVAVIATLEARLSFTEVAHLEAELPGVLRDRLHREPILDLPAMDANELFARVRARLRVPREQAETLVRVVLHVLRTHVSPVEAQNIEAELSPQLGALWRAQPHPRG